MADEIPESTVQACLTALYGAEKAGPRERALAVIRTYQDCTKSRRGVRATPLARTLTCVYCGHEYPQDTPAAGSEILTEHIAVCEKHPMRGFIALLTEAAERLEENGLLGQMSHRFQAWRIGGLAPLPFCDSVFSEPGGVATHCELTAGHSRTHKRGSFSWANTKKCPGRGSVECRADISFHEKSCSECATEGPV